MTHRTSPALVGHAALVLTLVATAALMQRPPESAPVRCLVLLVVALGAYTVVLAVSARWSCLSRRVVLAASGLLLVLAVAAPPMGSNDVWSYAMYGRIVAAHHDNPYRHPPSRYRDDPWYRRVASVWRGTPSVYGPGFTAVSAVGMSGAGLSPLRARLFFQGLSALGVLAALLVVDRQTRDPGAVAFLGLNPIVVASAVNGAHNDVLVGLAVLAAVQLVGRRRLALAGLAVGLGALVKIVGLLALPALAAWALRHYGARAAARLAAAGGASVVVGYALAGGTVALGPVAGASRHLSRSSMWFLAGEWRTRELISQGLTDTYAEALARQQLTLYAILTVVGLGAILVVGRLRTSCPVVPVAAPLVAYLAAGAYVLSWYPAWVLPALALRWRLRLSWFAVAQAGLLMVGSVYRPRDLGAAASELVRIVFLHGLPALHVVVAVGLAASGLARLVSVVRARPAPAPSQVA